MEFKETILVVDDEPDLELLIRQKFRKKIRANEWLFTFATNGHEALEVIDAGLDNEPDSAPLSQSVVGVGVA